jgi:hypothetical protein
MSRHTPPVPGHLFALTALALKVRFTRAHEGSGGP